MKRWTTRQLTLIVAMFIMAENDNNNNWTKCILCKIFQLVAQMNVWAKERSHQWEDVVKCNRSMEWGE